MQKKTIQDMQNVAKIKGGICISDEYLDARTPLRWGCSKGHEWMAAPVNITSRNSWCPFCQGQKSEKASIDYMRQIALERGGKCSSEVYINSKTKLKWECNQGHQWEAIPLNVINKGSWCPECHRPKKNKSSLVIKRKKVPVGFWNLIDNCKAEASKYSSRTEWMRGSPLSHKSASKNGWLDECTLHMPSTRMPDGYWTLEKCREQAQKYQTKVQWRTTHKTSFSKANKEGWLADCCSHMERTGLWFGPASILETLLAHDIRYFMEHRFKGFPEVARRPFDFYLPDFNLIIEFHGEQHLIGWGRKADDAKSIQKRDKIKKDWAIDKGIEYLEIWQRDIVSKEDIQNKVLDKLKKINKGQGLDIQLKKRSLTDVEIKLSKNRIKWTEEECLRDAKKYKTVKEWTTKSPSGYQAAFKKGWKESCTSHMVRMLTPKNYWTLERCKEDAKKYKTKSEWSRAKPSGYAVAVSRGWIAECCSHMEDGRINLSKRLWTYEKCIELSKTCKTRAEFKSLSGSAYLRARVEGWLEDCCRHMK
jgi:very-short-patch-repair endonuclease